MSGDTHFSLPKSTLSPKAIFGSIFVALWFPFGSLLLSLGSLLYTFGSLLLSLGSLLSSFGSLLVSSCSLLAIVGLILHSLLALLLSFGRVGSFLAPLRFHFTTFRPSECEKSSKILFSIAPEAVRHPRCVSCWVSGTIFCDNLVYCTSSARTRKESITLSHGCNHFIIFLRPRR